MGGVILSIDPSTSSGVALFLLDEKTKELILVESAVLTGNLFGIGEKLSSLLDAVCPDEVYVEDYMFQMKARQGANLNSEIRGVIKWLVKSKLGYDPVVMNIGTWKKLATGNGRADKEGVKRSLISKGIACDYSLVDGKLLKFRDDESDAIAIGMAGVNGRWNKIVDARHKRTK